VVRLLLWGAWARTKTAATGNRITIIEQLMIYDRWCGTSGQQEWLYVGHITDLSTNGGLTTRPCHVSPTAAHLYPVGQYIISTNRYELFASF
jgi:hypothetical protein